MADGYERRDRGYGGGGGGYGGGNRGKKRRYDDDDDYDRRPRERQPRSADQPSRRVVRQLLSMAENQGQRPEDEVMDIARACSDNFEDEIFRTNVVGSFPTLIIEQPMRIPFAGAVLLHLNREKPEMAKIILDLVGSRLQEALNSGEWKQFKLLLRFLACVSAIFEHDALFPILDELFNRAVDLQNSSEDDVLGPELTKIIMLTIPYIMAFSINEADKSNAASMLENTGIIASAPSESLNVAHPFTVAEPDSTFACPKLLLALQNQLQAEADKGWPLEFIPRLVSGVEGVVKQRQPFPSLSIPRTIKPGVKPIFPEVLFSLYADQDIETVPKTSDIACTLIRDALIDTINGLHFNRVASSKLLIELDLFWTPGTFARRGIPFDTLKEETVQGSTWKPEDVAVDAIFSQIFCLPAAEHKLAYYHSMITETCKLAPGAIAPSLGRAIRFLYRTLDIMDVELVYRFMDWFSHHLSNFDYRWKWTEWVDDVVLSNLHPRKAFILGSIDKEIRLAFAKRIRDTLPEPYHALIPSTRENDIPVFKYNDEKTPYSVEGKEMLRLIRTKADEESLQQVFASIQQAEMQRTNGTGDAFIASTDAYVTSLCYIGSKSLSHVLSYIERHKDRLAAIGPASNAARLQIISSVVDYWHEVQPGVAVSIVDKLLNYGIITPASVVEWALSARLDSGRGLAISSTWEIVAGTINKVTNRIRQIARARINEGKPLLPDAAAQLEQTLDAEVAAMQTLFANIDDSLEGVAQGFNDGMIEEDARGNSAELVKIWGEKWRRAFARKIAVENTVITEMRKNFVPPLDAAAVAAAAAAAAAAQAGAANGSANGGANGGAADDSQAMDEDL